MTEGVVVRTFDVLTDSIDRLERRAAQRERRGAGVGTGLGLALARKVVEALGGAIRMKSCEGEGSRVEIELPVLTLPLTLP